MSSAIRNSLPVFLAFTVFLGCSYDKEIIILPPCPEAVGNISFAAKVEPVLQTRCFGCHNNSVKLGNVSLEGYQNIKICAETGKLVGSLTWAAGFYPMPKYTAKLEPCKIALIKKWVENGAPNN